MSDNNDRPSPAASGVFKIFLPLTRTSVLQAKIMAEIHDQFDTILILDFGSQVRSQLTLILKDLMKGSTVQPQNLVQPPDNATVP
jgi:hypothetical protein